MHHHYYRRHTITIVVIAMIGLINQMLGYHSKSDPNIHIMAPFICWEDDVAERNISSTFTLVFRHLDAGYAASTSTTLDHALTHFMAFYHLQLGHDLADPGYI